MIYIQKNTPLRRECVEKILKNFQQIYWNDVLNKFLVEYFEVLIKFLIIKV